MRKTLHNLALIAFVFILGACENTGQDSQHNYYNSQADTAAKTEILDSSLPISDELEPLEIARILVEQEMSKQVGLRKWDITDHRITSDNLVDNIADYDKPVGLKRIVWVTGTVSATATKAEGGESGNFGYDLELYKMDGDTYWYIDKHWGVLRDIQVADAPVVDESNYQLSDSDELPFPEESDNEVDPSIEPEDDGIELERYEEIEQKYLDHMNQHFHEIGLLEYVEGGKINVADLDLYESPAHPYLRQYGYYFEGELTDSFNALQENDQFDLLNKLQLGRYEFYDGHQFEVLSLTLTSGSDTYMIDSASLNKNGESFWHQLENPFGF